MSFRILSSADAVVGKLAPGWARELSRDRAHPARGRPRAREDLQSAPQPGRRQGREAGTEAHPPGGEIIGTL
eukprot:241136-Pyramimonas_sp.AAC.1